MILVQTADFVGYFWTPLTSGDDQSQEILQAFIDRYETNYIRKLLGVELGDLFIADKANVSQDARFAAIEDEFAYDDPDNDSVQWISRGMTDMLTAIIFYHYVTDRQARNTHGGVAVNTNEAQNIVDMQNAYRYAEMRFNEAVQTWNAIQWYVDDYAATDYPEYKGQSLDMKFSAIF